MRCGQMIMVTWGFPLGCRVRPVKDGQHLRIAALVGPAVHTPYGLGRAHSCPAEDITGHSADRVHRVGPAMSGIHLLASRREVTAPPYWVQGSRAVLA
jgi:hypothetical protein